MYGYIYKTTNLVNGKIYVGQHKATKFQKRKYLGSGLRIKEAIKKYGRSNFICELLDTAETFEELNQKEIFWISKLNAVDETIGYNLAPGGQPEDIHTVVLGEFRKLVTVAELNDYLAAGWIDTRSEIYHEYKKQKRNAYLREHPRTYTEEQIKCRKQTDHEHYLANKEKYTENAKNWQLNNKERWTEWLQANKDRINEQKRTRYNNDPNFRAKQLEKSRRYRESHREQILAKQRAKRKKDKETK